MPSNEDKLREYLKRVTADFSQVRGRLRELEAAGHEPIAIVGMACRYPGGADAPEELWRLVDEGRDAISTFPTDRGWEDDLYDPDPDRPGKSYVVEGGFVYDVGDFDPELFGISPREALAMDPQQRLLLEAAWEACERAGIAPLSLRGSRTGVFVGAVGTDYATRLRSVPDEIEGFLVTGTMASVISGRIAYLFGLEGPAVTVDTSCSSSLVAIHLAVQSLRKRESGLALAGGVTVMTSPAGFVGVSRQRGLAPDGRAKAFGAGADGTSWAEGVGVLLLERLSEARRNGHPVLAVIRGSAANQDGASNGLSAPSELAQRKVIQQALADARLSPSDVDVVEAHGTGTKLGDPIEAQALLATYGQDRPADRPLWLGSIKSNIGHAGAAAGVAGVVKMVLAMRQGVLPRTLHVDEPTPHVDWSAGAVRLLAEPVGWPAGADRPRRAGVSSFGISGTNAHVVLEQAPPEPESVLVPGVALFDVPVVAWVVSARNEAALREQATRVAVAARDADVAGVGWGLVSGRSVLEHRAVVWGTEREELVAGLQAVAAGEGLAADAVSGVAAIGGGGDVVFVFPGQGWQWLGMGRQLLQTCPVFAARMAQCQAALASFVDWSLVEVLTGDDDAWLERVEVLQPVLWAVMVSLAAVWQALGVTPAAVVGYSQGEIAAAVVAGALSLEDGARVVALRSQISTVLMGCGALVSVGVSAEVVTGWLGQLPGRGWVAGINGAHGAVVSGEPVLLDALLAHAARCGVRASRVAVSFGSHSPLVEPLRERYLSAFAPLAARPATVPVISTVTGQVLDGAAMAGEYWYDNLRSVVLFEAAMRTAVQLGHRRFLEISAHPVLTAGVQDVLDTLQTAGTVVVGTLRRDDDSPARLLASAAELWVHGVAVDWAAVFAGRTVPRVELPTYAFQRRRYWLAGQPGAGDPAGLGLRTAGHPLLGAAVTLAAGGGLLLTGWLSLRSHPWLGDHAVAGTVLMPGTGFVELAIRAGDEVGCSYLRELTLQAPLVLPEQGGLHLQVVVAAPDGDGEREITVYSRLEDASEDQPWTCHAEGVLSARTPEVGVVDLAAWPPPGAEAVDVCGFYPAVAAGGYGYGPAFQGLTAAWRRGDEVFAEVSLPESGREEAGRYGIHPALLDAALHANGFGPGGRADGVRLPFAWAGVSLLAAGATTVRVRIGWTGDDTFTVDVADATGQPVAAVESLALRPVNVEQLTSPGTTVGRDALYRIDWVPLAGSPASTAELSGWAVLGEDGLGVGAAVQEAGWALDAYPDMTALRTVLDAGVPAPQVVLLPHRVAEHATIEDGLVGLLAVVQAWLADDRLALSRLVVVTRGAVAVEDRAEVPDLRSAPAWGLLRTAQSEHPDRFLLLDIDPDDEDEPDVVGALATVLASAELASAELASVELASVEPQAALRGGTVLAPRLVRADAGGAALVPPEAAAWRLDTVGSGTLENLALVPFPEAAAPLAPGQVRVEVRAAGMNFRDVLVGLGMLPGQVGMGSEAAGVVVEVGTGVTGLAVGDRVMGVVDGAFGPLAVADARVLVPMPAGWSFTQTAAVPVAFLTAYYGLVDLAGLRAGERVLVHAGAGGVGMAAVQLARYLGAQVFATASPGKWGALRELGLPESHIASSRSVEFADRVLAVTGGAGVDVVLNSLAREFVDASLGLLGEGGRFLELGKTDIRDLEQVAAQHPGVRYRAYSPGDGGLDRAGEILRTILGLFQAGALRPLPVTTWDVRRSGEAFRFMSQARHVGKVVLTMPPRLDREGTVLVTGGTGTLGGLLARHLVQAHGVRHLLLASRQGLAAPGAGELVDELRGAGATVRVEACDVADRERVAALLAGIPAEHPLTGVVHTAGALDDGVVDSLTEEQVRRVLRPKVDAALVLHELTRRLDLAMFVLYSSASGIFGAPGQGNYAAANAFLDALAADRHAHGLPAMSLAWGFWAQTSGLTRHMGDTDRSRVDRSGLVAIPSEEGLALFDRAVRLDVPLLLPSPMNLAVLRSQAAKGALPALLRALVRAPAARRVLDAAAPDTSELKRRISGLSHAERQRVILGLVGDHVAAVLGHANAHAIEADRPFRDLGFDSLTAVEMRNRLNAVTGLRLPATLVFDHPTPAALTAYLCGALTGTEPQVPAQPVTVDRAAGEPVAIVGMACRFPGGVSSPEDLWRVVLEGVDAISPFPTDRGWDLDNLYDPDPDAPAKTYARAGGFLQNLADFDPDVFGISPREALAMDPQQRLLLEAAWEACEHAGIAPSSLRGTQTGVFVGALPSEYSGRLPVIPEELEGFIGTGNMTSVASGRVAYALGLEGSAVTVDTACSSSLVALHLAVQALRQGECSLALAGGVTVMCTPAGFVGLSRQRGISADGRCRAFAAAADGFGPAEGVGVLVLERLSDARRRGRRVWAVVRGSAVNQDGASNGLTAPNGPSQQRVIRQALANAGLLPSDVDVVEGHGTGTTLGDPIEAQALLATYGQDRPVECPLWLGSVKSNIGHAQAAAGVAGVVKMVMAMWYGVLPRTLHVDEPSPYVDWSAGAVRLLGEPVAWDDRGRPRRAGVSSFGISGTNAHVVLEQAPVEPRSGLVVVAGRPLFDASVVVWVVSGCGGGGLAAQAGRLVAVVAAPDAGLGLSDAEPSPGPDADLGTDAVLSVDPGPDPHPDPDLDGGVDVVGVGWALVSGRAVLGHRAVVWGETRGELVAGLRSVAAGDGLASNVVTGVAAAGGGGGVVFVFAGQGWQWLGMGRQLLRTCPVFAARLAECQAALVSLVDWSLTEVLTSDDDRWLRRVEVVQPVLWAVMVSLAQVWRALGVAPAVVVGHSQGEIAAAVVAGVLSLADGARVVVLRSQALTMLAGRGGMVSVAAPADQVSGWCEGLPGSGGVAAVNGPQSTVVSGEPVWLDALISHAQQLGVWTQPVPVDYASHSSQVDQLQARILADLADLHPTAGSVQVISTVTGQVLDTATMTGDYWFTNLRSTVQFQAAVRTAVEQGHTRFVEVSAHPVLTAAVQDILDTAGVTGITAGTLRRDDDSPARLLASAAELWVHGVPVDWTAVYAGRSVPRVDLPTYAFQRRRYWLAPQTQPDVAAAGLNPAEHPLLGAAVSLAAGDGLLLTGRLSLRSHPWLGDHAVAGTVLMPGTGFVELAVRAGDEVGCSYLRELVLQTPLVLPEQGGVDLQVVVAAPDGNGERTLTVYSRPENAAGEQPWTCHAEGVLSPHAPHVDQHHDLVTWPPPGAEPVDLSGFYQAVAARGYGYGPAFQGLTAAWRRGDEVFAEVSLPESVREEAGRYGIHPALLDAALHANGFGPGGQFDGVRLPFVWSGVSLLAAAATTVRARITWTGPDALMVHLADAAGQPVATVESLVLRPVNVEQLASPGATVGQDALFRVDWVPWATPAESESASELLGWAVLGEDCLGVGAAVQDAGWALDSYPDMTALRTVLDAGVPAPPVVLLPHRVAENATVGDGLVGLLAVVQAWLADERLASSRLVVVTRGAVAVEDRAGVPDLASAPAWGLLRTAQSEHPDRFVLLDIDPDEKGEPDLVGVLATVLASAEPQAALRGGGVLVPRLARVGTGGGLVPPVGVEAWRLDVQRAGTLEGLGLVASAEAVAPLAAGQVRVRVRAAGVNFRDVLVGLGMYPGEAVLGSEAAGVVVEVGAQVHEFVVGDRVMGLVPWAFGPLAVADAQVLAPVPDGWSFVQAAAVPVAFVTAYLALVDLGGVRAGERVLVHAGAGGVGMAAVQLAQYLGAQVFATASPGKWGALRELGLPETHVGSSRSVEFADRVLAATGGAGVDVALNSLAGELVDASLGLLRGGGRFVELGRTDLRDAGQVAGAYPGVSYRVLDIAGVGLGRVGQVLRGVLGLLRAGVLRPLPVTVWDVRRAGEALRFMSQARHVGKVVLSVPPRLDERGTVLVTGGTGTLGGLVAEHLVTAYGVRHVVLASRQGPAAPGAGELTQRLRAAGASVVVRACDVAEREQLAGLLAQVPAQHPLVGVVHAAGVLDDGLVESLTGQQVERVLRAKVDAAVHLHELTQGLDVGMFVLFSSAAGVFGAPGQGNYAAANAFLDALAAQRRALGLAGVSLAWGYWARVSGLTRGLGRLEHVRMAAGGLRPLSDEQGLALFDISAGVGEPLLVAARLDLARFGRHGYEGGVPALLRGLVGAAARPLAVTDMSAASAAGLVTRLARLGDSERDRYLLDLVRGHVATVLGHTNGQAVEPDRPFKSLGFDSLTAVELRNRLSTATGLRLPATLIFDHPTPAMLATYLRSKILVTDAVPAAPAVAELDRLEAVIASASADDIARNRVRDRLRALLSRLDGADDAQEPDALGSATDEELFELLDEELGAS